MALQGLISGAECAVSTNPLARVLSHTESDRSIQHDRVAGPSTARSFQLSAAPSIQANEQDLALARQFFHETPSPGPMIPRFSIQSSPDLVRSTQFPKHEPWAAEFAIPPQAVSSIPITKTQSNPAMPPVQQLRGYMPQTYNYSFPTRYGIGMPALQHFDHSTVKGKAKEIDFEAAFSEFMPSQEHQTTQIEEVAEGVTKLEDMLNNMSWHEEVGQKPAEEDFGKLWEPLGSKEDVAKWEAEFSGLMNAERDALEDFGNDMQMAYQNRVEPSDVLHYDENGMPELGPYIFMKDNPHISSISSSLLDDAKRLLEQNGSLSEAALMLEAAIQRGELGDGGYEAWVLLGETRNMDEREEAGIRALMEGVKKAELANSPAGMLSLAISFTNENFEKASFSMLLRWFQARYPDVHISQDLVQEVKSHMAWSVHGKVTDLFLNLARKHHAEGRMDEDLQAALGVLFYGVGEYERAQDCFSAALTMCPRDYLLWNRLGSSLSNGHKPEEALGAYREALQLRPTYTRAIYNVGVACLNIGANKEAAEHFLSALSLQESSGTTETSDSLWSTLRKAFYDMDRPDLVEMAKPGSRSTLDEFRKEGFDF